MALANEDKTILIMETPQSKTALITGIHGQDGSYLAQLLLEKGYIVHGVSHTKNHVNHDYLDISNKTTIHQIDLENSDAVNSLINDLHLYEIYHLASSSSVRQSLDTPVTTIKNNILPLLNLLEAVRQHSPTSRLFNASSSEIFDRSAPVPYNKKTTLAPQNPYAVSKATGQFLVQTYRQQYNLFMVNGILFPHESPLRSSASFIKQLINCAYKKTPYTVATTKIERDFGDARDYVRAMWLSLQQTETDDYIISSGQTISTEKIIDYIFETLGAPRELIKTSGTATSFYLPTIFGDNTDTKKQLAWEPTYNILTTISDMIEFEKLSSSRVAKTNLV